MAGPEPTGSQPLDLDFDGEYGRNYRTSIRGLVTGYDALIEISAAALQQAVPQARTVLVVGPGLGEELVPVLAALPETRFTLLEPSEQMRRACAQEIAAVGASERCQLLDSALAAGDMPPGAPFDAVVSHNVLHLMPPAAQLELLQTMANLVAPGGALLLSSFSEPPPGESLETMLAIALTRLRRRGLSETMIQQLLATRNKGVFSLDQARLETALAEAGLERPLLLLLALANRLWLSRRMPT